MNSMKYITLLLVVLTYTRSYAQEKSPAAAYRMISIEPGIGIHTNFGTDLLITNLVQWNPYKHLSFAAHSSYNINNILQRDFNNIKTEYNYSFNQKVGAGTIFYSTKSSHTVLLMAGFKYTAYKETLASSEFDQVSTSINRLSPDYGMMYSYKRGLKKYFFTFRMYLPLYPWPIKGSNLDYLDGNMNNVALEFGVGIKIK